MKSNGRHYEFIPLAPKQTATDEEEEDGCSSEEDLFVTSSLKAKGAVARSSITRLLSAKCSNKVLGYLALGVVALILIVCAIYIVYLFMASSNGQTQINQSSNVPVESGGATVLRAGMWHKDLTQSTTILSMAAKDINSDGVPDIILDAISDRLDQNKYIMCPDKEDSCIADVGIQPCRIRLVALDGKDGSKVWEKWLKFSPFAMNCNHDLNSDGTTDCTLSGRNGAFAAVSTKDSDVLWYIDPAVTFTTYNFYYPLFIRDFDNDGVIDMVITHGGDTIYPDSFKNRSPGFIFVISGKTGQQISEKIFMPDGHETYNSPISYSVKDGIEIILFGSGGETIPGSLWAITVDSLQEHVNTWATTSKATNYEPNKLFFDTRCLSDEEVKQMRPEFNEEAYKSEKTEEWMANCPVWNNKVQPIWNEHKLCVYEVLTANTESGVIVPPVVIDSNGDGVKDLLMAPLNDHIVMMDGASHSVVWDHHAVGTQSYSIPSPFHFNDDGIHDYMFRLNKGKWPNYEYSYMAVLDGSNGNVLWSLNCSAGAMGSAITIKSKRMGYDGILFIASGCEDSTNTPTMGGTRTKRDDNEGACRVAHSGGTEQSTCLADRYKRHGDDNDHHSSNNETESETHKTHDAYTGPQVLRPMDIDFDDISDHIPTDIWEKKNEADVFPDPQSDARSFIREYCGMPYDQFVSKMYFVTPQLMKSNNVKPIMVHTPYVHKSTPGSHRKRHTSQSDDMGVNQIIQQFNDIRAVRCAHVLVPMMQETTPILGDFNNDGKIDVATSLTIDGFPGEYFTLRIFHPAKVSVDVVSIEKQMMGVYGASINETVDFGSFYPAHMQPWGGYMGTHGNGVYEDPESS